MVIPSEYQRRRVCINHVPFLAPLNGYQRSSAYSNGSTFMTNTRNTCHSLLHHKRSHIKSVFSTSRSSDCSEEFVQDLGRFLITSHCLGSGSYATVQLALDTTGHQQAACKIIRRKEGHDFKKEMKEATLLMNLHHVRA